MSIQTKMWLGPLLVGLGTLMGAHTAAAQSPVNGAIQGVPIDGFTGIIGLQWTIDKFYSDVNTVLVKTSDGVEDLVHVTKGTTVRGGSASLDSLRSGTAVVVHYTVKGIQASADDIDRIGAEDLKVNEGTVTRVDRDRKRVTIQFANGTTETLRLSHAVIEESDGQTHRGSRVIVYYSDESGQRVAYYFKPVH